MALEARTDPSGRGGEVMSGISSTLSAFAPRNFDLEGVWLTWIKAPDRCSRKLQASAKVSTMAQLLEILPLLAALTAAPAFAAQADPHAGHHPAAPAETPKAPAAPATDAKSAKQGCPMMDGEAPANPVPIAGKGADGKMMMDGKAMHCMSPPVAAEGVRSSPDHDHPAPAPK